MNVIDIELVFIALQEAIDELEAAGLVAADAREICRMILAAIPPNADPKNYTAVICTKEQASGLLLGRVDGGVLLHNYRVVRDRNDSRRRLLGALLVSTWKLTARAKTLGYGQLPPKLKAMIAEELKP